MLVVLLVLLLVAPVSAQDRQGLAKRAFERQQRAAVREARGGMLAAKVKALRVPGAEGIRVVDGWAPGYEAGMSAGGASRTEPVIYQPGAPLEGFELAHEAGHVLAQKFSDADKARFQRLMGPKMKPGPWDRGTGYEGGFQSPSEWFADYYAMAAMGQDMRREGTASYAPLPSNRRLLRFGRALERYGRRNGLPQYVPPGALG